LIYVLSFIFEFDKGRKKGVKETSEIHIFMKTDLKIDYYYHRFSKNAGRGFY